jgi:hypothetical protein
LVPILVVGGLMLAEGIGVFILAKSLSPAPASAIAAGLGAGKSGSSGGSVPFSSDSLAEVELADCRPINKMSGRFLTFQVRVAALVDASDAELLTALARQKRARIEDAINTVVRSAEPSQLNEPTLDTLERRIKMEMDKIFGDDKLIKAILIPQFLQSGPGV